jgi:hypothetical protein
MTKSAAASAAAPPGSTAAAPSEGAPAAPAAPPESTPAASPESTPAAETSAAAETTPEAESTPQPETTPAAESIPEAAAPTPAAGKDGVKAKTSDLTAGPGGVMTDEVGVVTGDLTLRSELDGTALTLRVQYKDADEWYKVTGGKATLKDAEDLEAVHKIAVGILNRPEG